MLKIFLACLAAMLGTASYAGDTARVLFIGNSYTYVNDLPLMLKNLALSTGDVVEYDGNLIGGATLRQHSANAVTLGKIAAGNWDFVVLQEQSQLPAFPDAQVAADVYPYARMLDSLIRRHNPCAETIFYNTWGRKNGDAPNCASWPPLCTYSGMDSLLRLRYGIMAAANNAIVAPAGPVWRRIRSTAPGLNLYDPDESHPSVEGTYAAACAFYAVIFRKNPAGATFNSSLSPANASTIRLAAKAVAFDSLAYWNVGSYDPVAAFSHTVSGATVTFTNASQRAGSYRWLFGNGQTSTAASPVHTYSAAGTFQVKLVAGHCGYHDTISHAVTITKAAGIPSSRTEASIGINFDAHGTLHLKSDRLLSRGTVITIFGMDGRVAGRQITSDNAREARLEFPLAGQLYVVTVEDPAQGLYWRQALQR